MSYGLVVRVRAEDQIKKAFDWYEDQRVGLGKEFLLCIDAKLQVIRRNPHLFQIKYRNIRCALVPRFPYGIFYFVEDDSDKIIVIAVFHLSRDPKFWSK